MISCFKILVITYVKLCQRSDHVVIMSVTRGKILQFQAQKFSQISVKSLCPVFGCMCCAGAYVSLVAYVCECMYMWLHMDACMHAYVIAYAGACICRCICRCIHMCACMLAHMHLHACVYVHVSLCMYVCVCTCVYIYVCTPVGNFKEIIQHCQSN